jgi:arabinogalactan oligomer/maltooligosaccharide transport system permease protein
VSRRGDSLDEGIWSIGKVPAAGMVQLFEKDQPHVQQRRQSFGRWFRATGWRHVVGVLALIFALFPVWFVVLAAFSPSASLSNQRLWPETFTLRQYRALVDNYPYWQWFWNSLVISVVTAGSTVLLASSAAFASSRLRFKGRRTGLFSLLLIQMFPASLAFVAIYIMIQSMTSTFDNLGSGSMATIILFYLGGALGANAWLIKGFFDTIPFSLDESAKIDGATHAQIFWKIILPLAAPVLAIIFLLSFISSQAEFLLASVILFGQDISSPSQTVATGLRGLLAGDRYDLRWGPFAVGALIASLPVVLLFQFIQRYIVGGITAGAVKG